MNIMFDKNILNMNIMFDKNKIILKIKKIPIMFILYVPKEHKYF